MNTDGHRWGSARGPAHLFSAASASDDNPRSTMTTGRGLKVRDIFAKVRPVFRVYSALPSWFRSPGASFAALASPQALIARAVSPENRPVCAENWLRSSLAPAEGEGIHDPLRLTRCASGTNRGIVGAPASWTARGLPPLFFAPRASPAGQVQPRLWVSPKAAAPLRCAAAVQNLAENERSMGRPGVRGRRAFSFTLAQIPTLPCPCPSAVEPL